MVNKIATILQTTFSNAFSSKDNQQNKQKVNIALGNVYESRKQLAIIWIRD